MINLAAAARLALERGTGNRPINLQASANTLLVVALVVAGVLVAGFARHFYSEWKLKRDFPRPGGFASRRSKGYFRYWLEDWKKRREFQKTWNRKKGRK